MNKEMYTQLVMEYAKDQSNHRTLENPTHVERGYNPSCGDDLTVMMRIVDGIIVDATYIGDGCAISKAAVSMMIDQIKGKHVDEASQLADHYLGMVRGEAADPRQLGNLSVFENLKNMPARVKCGTLGMHCLKVITDPQD